VVLLVSACQYHSPGSTAGDDDTPPDASIQPPDDPPDDPPEILDTDGDGIADVDDNCPLIANANQADEDADLVGDKCDNCPHVANADQANVLETQNGAIADLVGDACDPQPTTGGNSIRLFLGFSDPADLDGWTFAGNDSYTLANGSLVLDGSDLAIMWKNDLGAANSFVETSVTYDAIDASQSLRGATLMTRFERSTDFGHGLGCGEIRGTGLNPSRDLVAFLNGGYSHNPASGSADVSVGHQAIYKTRGLPGTDNVQCTFGTSSLTGQLGGLSGTGVNFAAWGATVSFHYLVIID